MKSKKKKKLKQKIIKKESLNFLDIIQQLMSTYKKNSSTRNISEKVSNKNPYIFKDEKGDFFL